MLNRNEDKIHQAALDCAARLKHHKTRLVGLLIRIERTRLYRRIARRTLVDYIRDELKIDSTSTFQLQRVVLAAVQFAPLANALEEGRLRVGHASRILAKLTEANVSDWVEFASTHTFTEVVERVACSNATKPTREVKKRLTKNQTRLSLVVNDGLLVHLERIQALLAQRGRPSKMADALAEISAEYLERHDPVQKAERSQKRSPAVKKVTLRKIVHTTNRIPFTATQKHAVYLRSQGRCTFSDHRGRCTADRHTHIHHLVPVADGGSNDSSNLTLVCSFHHDYIHQTSFAGMEMPWTFANADQPEKTS